MLRNIGEKHTSRNWFRGMKTLWLQRKKFG